MTLTLGHYLSLGAMLFALSVIGIFLNRKNLIILLMAIELMLLAVNMNFVAFSYYLNDMAGHIFVFFILMNIFYLFYFPESPTVLPLTSTMYRTKPASLFHKELLHTSTPFFVQWLFVLPSAFFSIINL